MLLAGTYLLCRLPLVVCLQRPLSEVLILLLSRMSSCRTFEAKCVISIHSRFSDAVHTALSVDASELVVRFVSEVGALHEEIPRMLGEVDTLGS